MTTPLFDGGGELGRLMEEHDWAATPLGPVAQWPSALKTLVRLMLTSSQPIWIGWGPELTYLYNDPYKSIIGGKHPWALGRPTQQVWEEIWPDIQPLLASAAAGKGTYVESQLLIMERNGYPEETYYTFSYCPVPGDDGRYGGVFCANTDETLRVVGQRELALLSALGRDLQRARTLAEACALGLDALATNPKDITFSLLYLPSGDGDYACGKSSGITAGAPGVPARLRDTTPGIPVQQALASGRPQVFTAAGGTFGHAPGAWQVASARAALIPLGTAPGREPAGLLLVGLNPFRVFEQRYEEFLGLVGSQLGAGIGNARAYAAERQRSEDLEELDRAKTQFFSNVSHEFRTPLTLLLGPIEEALATELPPQTGLLLQAAHRNGLRLLKLVNTLLDFSRIEAGRAVANFVPLDLEAHTRELANSFRPALERAGLAFDIQCRALPGPAHVDADMWDKIVLNLLSNAFKFTFEGGVTLSLGPDRTGERAILSVRDTGVGVPERELPQLFDRFHRVEGQRSRSFEGSGIGLALVQELVKLHQGTIAVDSVEGQGTGFDVSIPLVRAGAVATVPPVPRQQSVRADAYVQEALRWLPQADGTARTNDEGAAPQGQRVLVVDDNADMRDYISRVLRQHWRVEVATDGAAAWESIQADRPDLVLSDVMMPGLNGFELVERVRTHRTLNDLPVVLLSARAGEEAEASGIEAGADDYLVKPFAAHELVARVAATLRFAGVRRQVEHALRQSEQRFRHMADNAPVMIWITDADANCIYLNKGWYSFTGQTEAQALGFGWLEATHPDDRDPAAQVFLEANERRAPFRLEYRLRRHDGEYRWAIDSASPRFETDGSFSGYIGTVIDITERKEAEALLRSQMDRAIEQDRQKDVFLATLAHELRNPLAPIRTGMEILRRIDLGPQGGRIVGMVDRQLLHMVRLVDDLLDVSRVSRGRIDLQQHAVTLASVMESAIDTSRPLLDAAGHTLDVQLPPETVLLHGDATRLSQIFSNILNNAAKYTSPGGFVRVAARVDDSMIEIRVTDTGRGIPPDMLEQVFEMFSQVDIGAHSGGGLGIGLSLVRKLVELHGGNVRADSKGVGQGSAFTVRLPVLTPEQQEAPGDAGAPAAQAGQRILVVDDNVDAADSLGMLLESQGHAVKVVYTGNEAEAAAEGFAPGVIFLDIGLPDVSGYEVARRLRDNGHPRYALVALTGWGDETARSRTTAAGFDRHLTKPVDFDTVVKVLGDLNA